MNEQISITIGNHKLGKGKVKIANTSLTPVISCPTGVPCAKKGECYAMKAYIQYPNAKNAWDKNLRIYLKDSTKYFQQLNQFLQDKLSVYFRYLVGGDIPDTRYLLGMVEIASRNPQTSFMSFTKNYGILASIKRKDLPKNLNIIASGWPKYPMPDYVRKQGYRIAWMQDGIEKRIKKNAVLCKGSCENCLNCWDGKEKRDVILPKH